MPLYKATFALRPELSEEQRDPILKRVKDVIVDEEGKIENIDLKGMQKFAYEVDELKEGFFVSIDFALDSSKANQIHEFLMKEKEAIRIMMIKQKISSKKKKSKGEKNERVKSGNSNRKPYPGS